MKKRLIIPTLAIFMLIMAGNPGCKKAGNPTIIKDKSIEIGVILPLDQEVSSYNAQYYDLGYLYALAVEKTLQKVDPDDLPTFRKTLNALIRPLSKEPGEILSPDMGWTKMKSECSKDEINYSGASGNCDIDAEGNASTAYALFAVEKSGEKFYFKILKIIP